jgi:hypothetical protein
VKAVFFKPSVKYEASSRCLVACTDRSLLRETPYQLACLVQVAAELDHLGLLALSFEYGGGDRFYVHVKPSVPITVETY